jgi:uncharacterized SAM-binding protein YcdF (DUF218 family)
VKLLKKIAKWMLIVCGAVVLLDAAVLAFFTFYHPQIKHADAIVVLGAAINTPALYNRSLAGLALYREGKAPEIILSGGRKIDADISEAGNMQKVIQKNSTTAAPIILEDRSRTTYENIHNIKAKAPGVTSIIIVSDEFHLARAVLVALRAGYYPVYWSAPPPTYYRKSELMYYYFREGAALLDYVPKFLWN